MRTFAYTKDSLGRLINQDDRVAYGIATAQEEADVINRIQSKLHSKTQPFSFKVFVKNGRTMCKPLDIETAILVRKVNKDFSDLGSGLITRTIRLQQGRRRRGRYLRVGQSASRPYANPSSGQTCFRFCGAFCKGQRHGGSALYGSFLMGYMG